MAARVFLERLAGSWRKLLQRSRNIRAEGISKRVRRWYFRRWNRHRGDSVPL